MEGIRDWDNATVSLFLGKNELLKKNFATGDSRIQLC
jgi:hypothetical protein